MHGKVKELMEDQKALVALDGIDREVLGLRQGDLALGQAVAVSVRPEKLRLVPDASVGVIRNNPNTFQTKVVSTTYIGSDTRVVVDFGGSLRMTIWEQNKISTLDPQAYYSLGQVVWLTMMPENVLVLPE
jgi:ABC-type Fe3+/spermidine/putrescine transport system ATPase subunit